MNLAPALTAACATALLFSLSTPASADTARASGDAPSHAPRDEEAAPTTLLDHPTDSRFFVGGQANAIYQFHPDFPAAYSGEHSLPSRREGVTSYVLTLYLGVQLTSTTEVFFDGEMAAGSGIGSALGIAGFSNLDVVRNPTLGSEPYPARFLIRQIIPLSSRKVPAARGHLSMATLVPEDRLELRLGKMSTGDLFDVNAVGSDSHTQFMNWTVDSNGAYDYAADTRGYTYGAVVSLESRLVALRLGEMLMPTVANGITLDFHIDRARGENLELELHPRLLSGRVGVVRLLGFVNHANMGNYREAVEAFLARKTPRPDIEATSEQGRVKYGVGLNLEQELSSIVRVFGRAGWNEGNQELFAFTEVSNTVALGGDLRGSLWRRDQDKVGMALVSNGISADQQRYLKLGGQGFLLGDGGLTYGRETIFEAYYNAMLYRGVSAAADVQIIDNPGYNRDRGPVLVLSARGHIEI